MKIDKSIYFRGKVEEKVDLSSYLDDKRRNKAIRRAKRRRISVDVYLHKKYGKKAARKGFKTLEDYLAERQARNARKFQLRFSAGRNRTEGSKRGAIPDSSDSSSEDSDSD